MMYRLKPNGSGRPDPERPDRGPDRREILTIIGPTAVGKTTVALRVARELGGEIVSADSRQIYRGMNIGTAKPTAAELNAVPHHLIDVAEPTEIYDAARFAREAEAAIGALLEAGIEPLVVGGTGFYLASLFEGLFDGPGRDDAVRRELKRRLAAEGPRALHRELSRVDSRVADRIHPNDASRIVRALEVYLSTGRPLSEWQESDRRTPAYAPRYFGLTMPRAALYARIDQRVDAMMERGLLEEVRVLVSSGRLTADAPAATAVGYRELLPIAAGIDTDVASAVEEIKRRTRRYAKRQLTWFSSLQGVTWFDVAELGPERAAGAIVSEWLRVRGRDRNY